MVPCERAVLCLSVWALLLLQVSLAPPLTSDLCTFHSSASSHKLPFSLFLTKNARSPY